MWKFTTIVCAMLCEWTCMYPEHTYQGPWFRATIYAHKMNRTNTCSSVFMLSARKSWLATLLLKKCTIKRQLSHKLLKCNLTSLMTWQFDPSGVFLKGYKLLSSYRNKWTNANFRVWFECTFLKVDSWYYWHFENLRYVLVFGTIWLFSSYNVYNKINMWKFHQQLSITRFQVSF